MAAEPTESPTFLKYIQDADFRFLQERKLGIDLYNSGYLGVAVAALGVVALTIFALALFQIIPKRKHVAILLMGTGILAAGLGLVTTYWNFDQLAGAEDRLISMAAGPEPVSLEQEAVVIALPLLIGMGILFCNLAGCAYMAIFWSRSILPTRQRREAVDV